MNFSQVVKEKMKEQNLKIGDLARLTGYTWTHCSDLIKGNRRWNEDTIDKFCKALGIKIEFICDNSPSRSQQAG